MACNSNSSSSSSFNVRILPNPNPNSSSSSSGFFTLICILHSLLALTIGTLIMFRLHDISVFGHGPETALKLLGSGSSPRDRILIQASDSFAGLLLFSIGMMLFMVAFVRDSHFQSFFAKGCVLLHLAMAMWRIWFERRVEDLAKDWPRQLMGDFALALSWVFFLMHTWTERYD